MEQTDVIIVGAGPIGLELAVALKQAGVDHLHFDAGQIGQTITWYPRQARFFSSPERIAVAGVPLVTTDQSKATREQYLAYLRAVATQFNLRVRTYERITQIRRERGGFVVRTQRALGPTPAAGRPAEAGQAAADGAGAPPPPPRHAYRARRVVLAVGDMHRPRLLDIPGEDQGHVSHYFEEPHRYFRQRLLIAGGRNSAVEAALRCHHAGARVSISYRGEAFDEKSIKYWLLPEIKALIKHEKIAFYPRTIPTRITPTHVTLSPGPAPPDVKPSAEANGRAQSADGGPRPAATQNSPAAQDSPAGFDVRADFVLLLVGYAMNPELFEMAGVELVGENRAPDVDPRTMQTNVPGLYVAGTAAAGTQIRFRLFIENSHPHVSKIVESITGSPPSPELVNQAARTFALPES